MKRIVFASALLVLAACASGPSYQPQSSANAQGYSEQMIEKDRWRVRYTGSSRMTSAQVQDYALMRAAELSLANGAQWFQVVQSDTDAEPRQRYSIETDFGPDYAVRRSCGLLGCTTQAVPVMSRTERETVETRTVYEHSMEILMGHGAKLDGALRAYDAAQTFKNLQAKLG